MYIPRRKTSLSVAITASTTTDVPHLREKTLKLGFIGRAVSVFRAESIIIYRDKNKDLDSGLMEKILVYMVTPQYMRKRVFEVTPELRYAGILPPLRTPNHQLKKSIKELVKGEVRQGVIIKSSREESLVDVGLEKPITIYGFHQPKTTVNIKILKVDGEVEAETIETEEISSYWGYRVEKTNLALDEVVRHGKFDLKIATSKYGVPIMDVAEGLIEKWLKSKRVLIAFGSPTEGVREILARKNLKPEGLFDFTVNTIKNQGTETVRVEEALTSSLAVFNFLVND